MATRLVNPNQTLLIYRRSLQSMSLWLRSISSQNGDSSDNQGKHTSTSDVPSGETEDKWLDIRNGIFGPEDKRYPLPGNVGLASSSVNRYNSTQKRGVQALNNNNVLSVFIQNNYHFAMIRQVIASFQSEKLKVDQKSGEKLEKLLEYKIQSCPHLLKKDFQVLFPETNIMNGFLTIVTVCQKTENDMSEWSESAEAEREKLTEAFVTCSVRICDDLTVMGHWAEFIDPMSGSPYLGPHTNATFFETDERYRHLGFRIEDLGCCRVISHRTWGTRIYVGCLFTDARPEVVEELLNRDRTGEKRPVTSPDFKKVHNPDQGD